MDIWKFHLHWGWNPVLFFIVLGISLALALTMKKRVLWLVPALVIYLGLDWALPMSWLFKTIFWLGVLVVLATAVFPGRTRYAKLPFALISGVAILILVMGGFNALGDVVNGDGEKPSADSSQDSEPTETPSTEPPAGNETDTCPARFVQRDITDTKLNRFVKGGIDAATANKSRQKLLAAVGHDASILRFYATQFSIDNLPSEAKMLSDDATCLSKAGRQVHHDLTVVLNASGVKFDDAPDNVYNSGVNDKGLPIIDTVPGIRGNKKALKVTLPDGSQVILLVRCGNPVFEQPPDDFVPGPTDNPEPECEHGCEPPPTCEELDNCQPPPTEECPPGWTGTPPNCLEPKDPDQDPAQNGNAPEGGGHNDTNGPGEQNPQPTFPTQPYQPPPPPPAPAPSPTPSPTQPPEGGGSGGGQDNPPGDPGMP